MGSTALRRSAKGRTKVIGTTATAVLIGATAFISTSTASDASAEGADGSAATAAAIGGSGPTVPFSPHVDPAQPTRGLRDTAGRTGVKQFTLAFVTSAGSCSPLWGGTHGLESKGVVSRIAALRAEGGDVRISFGGPLGQEPAVNCTSVPSLTRTYDKVVDTYHLTEVDFDIGGDVLPDMAANTRRAQAVAGVEQDHPALDVSFTLPVTPGGLTQPGLDLLTNAAENGVRVAAVNVVAADRGASYGCGTGQYVSKAATATKGQLEAALGLSHAAAGKKVAVIPVNGVNDIGTETFTIADAEQLVAFAKPKGLGRRPPAF
jgi:hypothetical protein